METIIIISASTLILSIFLYLARKPIKYIAEENAVLLEYSKGFVLLVITICSIIPMGLFSAIIIKVGIQSNGDLIGFIVIIFVFICLGIYVYLITKKEKIMATPEGVFADYLFQSTRSLRWHEITQIKYSVNGKQLIFKATDNRKIKVSTLLRGFNNFCIYSSDYLPKEIFQDELNKAIHDKFITF
jgi:hypothetical protein